MLLGLIRLPIRKRKAPWPRDLGSDPERPEFEATQATKKTNTDTPKREFPTAATRLHEQGSWPALQAEDEARATNKMVPVAKWTAVGSRMASPESPCWLSRGFEGGPIFCSSCHASNLKQQESELLKYISIPRLWPRIHTFPARNWQLSAVFNMQICQTSAKPANRH